MVIRRATIALAVVLVSGMPAFADPIRCSTFLHNRDGSWRSFGEADVTGPGGVMHINEGEVLRSGDRSAKGEIARILDDMCGR